MYLGIWLGSSLAYRVRDVNSYCSELLSVAESAVSNFCEHSTAARILAILAKSSGVFFRASACKSFRSSSKSFLQESAMDLVYQIRVDSWQVSVVESKTVAVI